MANQYFELERSLLTAAKNYGEDNWASAVDLLRHSAEALNCEWATLWTLDSSGEKLMAHTVWTAPGLNSGKLKADTLQRTLTPSEGMPGHIWKSKRSSFSKNLEMDMALPRSLQALGAGLRAGLWLPVKSGENVSAVIEYLGKSPAGQIVLPLLDRFGTELGHRS